ncbi:MAG: EAL domain-containing protein [Oscillospiraceae bacterium]
MKHQVLIVEDNEIYRETLKAMLSDEYRILEAENGQEALGVLNANKGSVALILLDVMMPVMDGYTFLDIVKKDSVLSFIPVIVTTQGDSEADELAALEHGANDFITKPYRPQIIKHRAASLIKLRESAAMVNQFMYDRLTGLYSKDFFYRKVRERLAAHPDREYTLLCCNIENFRLYNDTFGRRAGDKLLKEAAQIFSKRVSENSICCRYNADRFLALTDKASEIKGRERFAGARKTTRSELSDNLPVKLGIYEIKDRSIPVEVMCDRAVWVVDTIKGIYDQYIAVYDDKVRNILLREQAITDAMETALAEKQFTVYFQPKHSLSDDSMVGAEALVRWVHPEWGFMSPGEFIPLFEKNGFIRRLDEYVWESVCEKLHEWITNGYSVVPVSVNVSRADIFQSDLVKKFCDLIEKYEIAPSLLHLEITESAYTDNPEQIISTVEELRNRGFIIEMDDFGSGYSSLNMLGEMSLDILKLDMKFIRNQMAKPVERSLLQGIIDIAHALNLKVVAEGVETVEQKERLRSMNCDIAQGYFYAKPTPAADYAILLQK